MDKTLTTNEAAKMTSEELRSFALTAPRQLALFATRYAAAKDAAAVGDSTGAAKFLAAAKESYKRAMEDEHGQCMRAAATAAVVAANGAELSATAPGGKHVVKLAMGHKAVTWLDSWAR